MFNLMRERFYQDCRAAVRECGARTISVRRVYADNFPSAMERHAIATRVIGSNAHYVKFLCAVER